MAAINREHVVELPPTALFHHPTIVELARVVGDARAASRGATAELEREIDAMSDEDVLRALAEEAARGKIL